MHAVVLKDFGNSDNLIYTEVPMPKLKPGWSIIKVHSFGINHSEIFTRKGLSPNIKLPRILGIDVAGEIYKTTSSKFYKGQKVISIMGEMGRQFDGSYAEYVAVPNEQIYTVKFPFSWAQLATLSETYYTSWGSFINLKLHDSQKVCVRGATSGVGIAFANLIKSCFSNIQLYGSTRNLTKKQTLIDMGYDEIIFDDSNQLQSQLKFDRILELVGPKTLKNSFQHLNEHGIICNTGQLGGQWYINEIDPIIDFPFNSYLTSFYSGKVNQELMDNFFEFIHKFNINATSQKIFHLSEIPLAHQYLENNQSLGKAIVLI